MIELVCVGAARGALREAAADYELRLGRFCRFSAREVKEERLEHTTPAEAMERERKRVEPLVAGAWLVVLDRGGRQLTSEQLAAFVAEREETPPHQLARVVLVEQLYRAFTILRGVPYHH